MGLLLLQHRLDELGRTLNDDAGHIAKVPIARTQHIGTSVGGQGEEVVIVRVPANRGDIDWIRSRFHQDLDVGDEPIELLACAPAKKLVAGEDSPKLVKQPGRGHEPDEATRCQLDNPERIATSDGR